MKHPQSLAHADRLRALVRQGRGYRHVDVRARGEHLVIELLRDSEQREPIARATRLDARTYGLSFRSHTGKWERMPITGDLEEIARALTQELGAYLDPANL